MSGIVSMVLLRKELNRTQLNEMEATIRSLDPTAKKDVRENWSFCVSDTTSLGGLYRGDPHSFSIRVQTPDELNDDDLDTIEAAFGFRPVQEVVVEAVSRRQREDHTIHASLILHFAEAYDGIIDFNCALIPPRPPGSKNLTEMEWKDLEPSFHKMIDDLPGKICSNEYRVPGGHLWVCHRADAEFLRAWMHHSNFYMAP